MARVAIVMEALEDIDTPEKHGSLALIEAAFGRGNTCFHLTPNALSRTDEGIVARGHWLEADEHAPAGMVYGSAERLLLKDAVDLLLFRVDPPFDLHYLTLTYLLECLAKDMPVINDPASVRNAPEKLLPFMLGNNTHRPLAPPTLISQDRQEIEAFIHSHQTVIAKPLYWFGGHRVHKLSADQAASQLPELLASADEPIMFQQFIPEVVDGDKRILLLDGEPIGGFVRKPKEGHYVANLAAGGYYEASNLTKRDYEICAILAPYLKETGLFLTGIDVIGEYCTEVNVTCPLGFRQLDALYGGCSASVFWEHLARWRKISI